MNGKFLEAISFGLFKADGRRVSHFVFRESLRADAIASLGLLKARNYRLVILSGDQPAKSPLLLMHLGSRQGMFTSHYCQAVA